MSHGADCSVCGRTEYHCLCAVFNGAKDVSAPNIAWSEEYRLWWPSDEPDHVYKSMLMRVTDVDVAVKHVRTTGVCVQAGGFLGMWPTRLAKYFERVYTFEPVPHLYECAKRNTQHLPSVRVYNCALGDAMKTVRINPRRAGCSEVGTGELDVTQVTIDSLCLIRCDAIFLDVEHYEMQVLEGAKQTIERFRPVITLEVKAETEERYIEVMRRAYKYTKAAKVHADITFVP